jgi:D-glycero-D-manno-heptose 1,7-bisphosphate phosphatase
MKTAVFLDRDGVVNKAILRNRRPFSPRSLSQFEILHKVPEAVKILQNLGHEIVVVTNQPEISSGVISEDLTLEIHNTISSITGIKHFYFCGHNDMHNCECRKPKPGMIIQAAQDLDLDLTQSYLVGDRWKDIQAGQKAGCTCYFIDNEYDEIRPSPPFITVKSLYEFAVLIRERI